MCGCVDVWWWLDFDIHHGNGCQEIFYASKQVLCVSLHRQLYGLISTSTSTSTSTSEERELAEFSEEVSEVK